MESNYEKLVEDLHDIEKTMFALGTSPMNMDNVSIRLAYDKRWGLTAADAAATIEALQKTLKAVQKNSEINFRMWEEAQAKVERLLAQLPKRGKWVKGPDGLYHCSTCGATAPYLDAFDGAIQYWENLFYCNNCGGKIEVQREVQE